jgi:hypothetical protein
MCFANLSSVMNSDLFWKQVFSYKMTGSNKRSSYFYTFMDTV